MLSDNSKNTRNKVKSEDTQGLFTKTSKQTDSDTTESEEVCGVFFSHSSGENLETVNCWLGKYKSIFSATIQHGSL